MSTLSHRPLGSGHPYRIDPDQRHPVQPVVGEPVELRVLAAPTVTAVWVEVDGEVDRTPLDRCALDDLYAPDGVAADGHLAAASGARPEIGDHVIWRTVLDAPPGVVRYRFGATDATDVRTEWFTAEPGEWMPAPDDIVSVTGDAALLAGPTEMLQTVSGPVRVRLTLALGDDERVVGFGERFDRLDQRGEVLDATVFEQYKQQGNRTYLASPFAIVTGGAGWGFHVDTARRVWFDVGSTRSDLIAIETTLDPSAPELSLRLYAGAPAEVLGAHLAHVGLPARPPDWVLRPWMSGNEWNTQARVLAEVERSVELDIPVGVVVIEAWSDEQTFVAFNGAEYEVHPDGAPHRLADFRFAPDGPWPDPAGMVARLHELGVKVLLWQIPLIPTDRGDAGQVAADAATLVARGYAVADEDGSPYRNRGWWFPGAHLPDWTNPEAVEWWIAKRRYLLDEVGVDGFKTDGGEHAWGDELRYHDGSRGVTANNQFANHYAAAYHRLLRECGTDGVTFSRAGHTGAGSVPCHWAGDEDSTWSAFRASITAGLTAGLAGVPFWGWDIAGFSGEIPSVELFARATAMATFCPIMQYHAEFNHGRLPSRDRTPWNLAERHRNDTPLTVYRRYAHLRERLLPYLSAAADSASATGMPLMRPVWFDHRDLDLAWDHPYEYLFGPDLVVAPVCWEGVTSLDVLVPPGEWLDPFLGDVHAGPAVVTVDAPLDRIPVLVRSGRDALSRLIGEL